MGQDLILDQILGQLASTLVAYFVIGEVELHEGGVEVEPGEDKLEQLIVDQVAREIQDQLNSPTLTKFCASFKVSAISLASVNFIPIIFFL